MVKNIIRLAGLGLLVTGSVHAEERQPDGWDFIRDAAAAQQALQDELEDSSIEAFLGIEDAEPTSPGVTEQQLETIAEQASDVVGHSLSHYGEHSGDVVDSAEQAARHSRESGMLDDPFRDNPSDPLLSDQGDQYVLFISPGQNPDGVRALVESYVGRDDIKIVIRGLIPPGRSITDTMRAMHDLISGIEGEPPEIAIDPTLFRQLNVSVVPTLAFYRDGNPVAWARGKTDPKRLLERVERGESGDLGAFGETAEIVERDLLEEIEERIANHDWDATRERAKHSYWNNRDALLLPQAEENAVRYLTPTMRVNEDIVLSTGDVLAKKGDVINPLDIHHSRLFLIVFDNAKPHETRTARELASQAIDKGLRPMLIATRLAEESFAGIETTEQELGHPIHLLMSNVRDQFQIRRTITTVQQEGNAFRVSEIATQGLNGTH